MTTINDVLRHLIRGGPNTEENVRRMLLTIDGHEKGFASLEEYETELAAQRESLAAGGGATTTPGESDADRAARVEADNERLRAQLGAQAAGAGGAKLTK